MRVRRPERLSGGDADMGRRSDRCDRPLRRPQRCARQAPSGVDQPQAQKMVANATPIGGAEAMDHHPVTVEHEGNRTVGRAMARGRHARAQAAVAKLAPKGGDNGVKAHPGLTSIRGI